MVTVAKWTEYLTASIGRYLEGKQAIDTDPRLREYLPEVANKKRAERLDLVKAEAVADVTGEIRALWGDERDPSKPLQGGAVWSELDAAEAELRQAKTASKDSVNYARLQTEAARLRGVVPNMQGLAELKSWYDNADSYERLALGHIPDVVRGCFSGDSSVGGFLARLESDRAGRFQTPEVQAAESKRTAAQRDAAEAWKVSRRAVQALSIDGPFDAGAGRVLRGVQADYSVEPMTLTESWEFAKRGPVITRAETLAQAGESDGGAVGGLARGR